MSETRKRTDLLNLICKIRKPKRYLEIGIQKGENFQAINCPSKIGVDPAPECDLPEVVRTTSTEFFGDHRGKGFDLIFIDGDHSERQTWQDIDGAWDWLNKGGLIVCHDALPHNLEYTSPEWCGEGYKAIMEWAQNPATEIITWEGDHGCAIFRQVGPHNQSFNYLPLSFNRLWENDAAIVNKSTWEECEAWLNQLR